MEKTIVTQDSMETIALGKKLGALLKPGHVLLLSGDLGAGKTTFTKGVGQALEIKRVINSPTFTIAKEYRGNCKLCHLDLYRLESLGDDFDLEEYFNEDVITVVEWPYNVRELWPNEYLMIEITLHGTKRNITLKPCGKKYETILEALYV